MDTIMMTSEPVSLLARKDILTRMHNEILTAILSNEVRLYALNYIAENEENFDIRAGAERAFKETQAVLQKQQLEFEKTLELLNIELDKDERKERKSH